MLGNLDGPQTGFLDFVYTPSEYYVAYEGEEILWILDVGINQGTIRNIRVDPKDRGEGCDRKIDGVRTSQVQIRRS